MFDNGLTYQDSRMSAKGEFTERLKGYRIDDVSSRWKGGPVLFREGKKVYVDDSEAHTLIVGDTGSMKTLRFVLPSIYACARGGESMVVVDPKGELAKKTCSFLKTEGYKTVVINLRSPQSSPDRWNPLARVQKLFNSRSAEDRETAFLLLNDLLERLFFKRSTADKDKYWNETSGQLGLGFFTGMENVGDPLTIKNLLKWRYQYMRDGTLESLYQSLPTDSTVYQNLSGFMSLTAENTRTCILSTFDQLIRVFKASPALTDMLSESTFEMNDLGTEKTAIFIIVPDEKTTFHFLANLFICQCYEQLLELADKYGGVLPQKINFFLEEFCNMPKLEDIIPMLTAARSRNIRFHLVIQSYEQMVHKYGEHSSKTIMDNCGNLIYLHSRELSFLKYISELAGVNEYGRPLLSASRLQRLKKNETIIFHDRCYPFLVQDIPLIFEYPVELGRCIPVK
ncbi:MAG: type IV secretory system conjugative DNA transfer family protein [Oscillospiraceae bacterium]|nr:type IV secretory system conjugative DNA transfer family protein [Oscillospiraceae bacterium]